MANKTYFKGKKKSTVKSKKYQFAGFDEATQIDNTGYLNALYNPKYFDTTAVNNEDIKQNVLADVATGQKLAMDKKVMQTTTDANLKRLQGIKNEAEAKNKQQFSEATEQNKDQAIISGSADLLTKGVDIAKQYMKPIAPAVTNTINVGGNTLPKILTLPGGKFGVGKTIDFSKLGQVTSSKAGAEVGKQGFTSALGSTTWATPGAAATAGGVGAVLSIGGKLWDTLSEDDNPYEYTKKEKWGDWGGNLLSEIGTYGGLGSMFGPLGTGIGAVVGAGIGTFKAIRESKKNKKQAADLNARKAEEDRLYQEQLTNYNNALASQQRFYDYSKNQLRNSILTGEERMRQNRLMGLTEGQLAGNTNIAMTGGGRKYFGKGGVNVPGGQVVPIGQGAVEFVGRKHSQGGIMLDSQTEVEGGETMDKVMMTGGKFNDYFFSDYLKNGGKSFAQHHKELIKRGASQEEIQALAKKQEAMANRKGEKDRSPKQVAEYGGIKKYQTGDFHQRIYTDPEEFKIANQAYQDSLEGFRKFPLLDGRGYGFSDNDISRPDFSSYNDPDTGFTNILNRDFANTLSICPSNMSSTCRGRVWVYKRPTEEPVYQDPDKIKYKPAPPLSVNLTPPPLRSNMMIESSPIGYRYQLHTGVKGSQVRVGYYKDGKYYPFSKERVQNEIEENRIPDQTEENYKKIQMQKQQQLKRNKTGGVKKYFTGGVRKYKTAGAVDDPVDPLIMTAIVRLGINDTNLNNYKKEKTNDGVKIKHITTGKEIFFNNDEVKYLTSSKNTYGAGEAILRAASEEEMKQMQSDTNPSLWDYAKGVYNVITNPFDAIQYENTRGNIMDDPANWLRMVEMDQQNNPNPVNELLELAPSVMSLGAAGPKYTVTMAPKAPNFGLGTGSAIPKSSLSRAYDLARPTFTRSPIMVPRVTAKQPAGTTVTTGAQRIATRNSGSTAVGNRFYDNRYYGRGDFWEQNLPPEVTVSGTASRKINIPSYTIKPPLAGFAGGYMGPFGEDFINYTTNPEYIGQYGTILNTGNNRNTGSNGSTENVDYNTGEYYKTDEERKAAEKIRQKVAEWASGYSGSTGRGGTGTSAGYTQSTTSAAPPFTGSLALGTGNSTKGQTAKTDDKKDDKKDLNMPEGKKEAIPFNRDLANRLALLQIGAGLPSIIPPLIALGKDIPTPNWDPFTYNRIPSVGGAPAITAGSVAAPRLSRVDYSDKMTKADEMALAAMNKSAEAGPQSGILNMAILGKNYRQILELQKQETDENKKQSDIEKQLAAKVSEGNRDAAMSAASKNAENILKTNDINSAINQANLGAELKRYEYISQKNDLEYRKNIEKYLTDLSALETLAGIPMQIASDTAKTYSDQYLAYLASDPTSGVYDRYINAMLGREAKKKTGGIKKYTSRLGDLVKNPKLKSKII